MDRRLWASAVLNVAITLAELAGGVVSGSLALLSDAAHNLGDVAAVVLALWARRLGRRPPTTRHTYGFKRAEVIAALANAVTLIVISVLIAREAVVRLLNASPVDRSVMLAVDVTALLANVCSALLLMRHDEEDVNVRSAFLHMVQDALASLAVVVAALLAHTAVGPWVDPAAALLVVALVLRGALSLVYETLSTLLEGAPPDLDLEALLEDLRSAVPEADLHHVHLWQAGPGQRLLTAHVLVQESLDGQAIQQLLDRIKSRLASRWNVTHATLEPEVVGCASQAVLGDWNEAAHRTPARSADG